MVRIINYKKRETEQGKEFFVLEIQGGMELVKSAVTGAFYATAKKASLSSTFDEATCKALIGAEIQGSIMKVPCEAYEYTIKETGEIIVLNHRYEYVQHENPSAVSGIEKSETTIDSFMKQPVPVFMED